jgi:DNA polymerase
MEATYAMVEANIDFETKATVDLKKTGVYPYAEHPDTDIWVMSYAIGDGEPQRWYPGEPIPARLVEHIKSGGTVRAWNAQFERVIWNEIMVKRYGAPAIRLEQWIDTAAEAAAMALPRDLERAARVTKVGEQKDKKGYLLMLKMTRPTNKKAMEKENAEPTWNDNADDLAALSAYCDQDVKTERAMVKVLRRLTPREREVYLMDQRVNDRGVAIDRELIIAAQEIVEQATLAADDQIYSITKGEVETVSQAGRIRDWLQVESIAKPVLKEMLASHDLSEASRTVLQLRSDVGRSSVAKLQTMLDYVCRDGRMRGMLHYHAAGTGRWGGKGPQPQNFPRGGEIKDLDIESTIKLVLARDYAAIEKLGAPVIVIMELLRSMMYAPPGRELIAADYSAIEARVVNWLAGQDDMIALFRKYDAASKEDKPRFDPYRVNAARIYEIPLDEVQKHPHRQVGKMQELACGFGAGPRALVEQSKDIYNIELEYEKIEEIVDDYRASHNKVVQLWEDANNAVIAAVEKPGLPIRFGDMARLTAVMSGAYLYIGLAVGTSVGIRVSFCQASTDRRTRYNQR